MIKETVKQFQTLKTKVSDIFQPVSDIFQPVSDAFQPLQKNVGQIPLGHFLTLKVRQNQCPSPRHQTSSTLIMSGNVLFFELNRNEFGQAGMSYQVP